FIAVNAATGLLKTICKVSINAFNNPLVCRWSHGNPLRGMGGCGVDVAPGCKGGGAGVAAANYANCKSGCQLGIPSRQPRTVERKRPVRNPSRTSSSDNVPKL